MTQNLLRIRGARTHNLKNIDLDLPKHQLVIITGLSGSGKSSLAFDTLYAEGQRRYVESLSAYARQFLQMMEKPDVDLIEGLAPAIAIEQKATSHNPRSTVGTVTEIHDYLRLLFARVGDPYCPEHDVPLASQSVSQMVDAVLALPTDTRVMILSPLVTDRKGQQLELIDELRAQGFVRLRVDGAVVDIDAVPPLTKTRKHTVEIVVDRLKVRPEARQRLAESFETALRRAEGRALAVNLDSDSVLTFSARFSCPTCQAGLSELEPRLFSFNNPMGACPRCDGLGQISFFDPKRVVAFPHLSLAAGAIKSWDQRNQFYFQLLSDLAAHYDFDVQQAFDKLPETIQQIILYGSGKEKLVFHTLGARDPSSTRLGTFDGIIPNLERRYRETDSSLVRDELSRLRAQQSCPECLGARLRREARHVRVAGYCLHELNRLPLKTTLTIFQGLTLVGQKHAIAEKILKEIISRLQFLNNVGLDYLQLDRSADTLSGGEAQRIRLASQIGSGLTGVMYVLDEPSIGLHQRDNQRLLKTLQHLRDLGNSVLVVEHDEDAIRAADFVVDMGPGAGEHGGQVIVAGPVDRVLAHPDSLTGQYLSGQRNIPLPVRRCPPDPDRQLVIHGASGHNLKHVTLTLPIGLMTCVTGVSGSGKSTLINDTLYAAVAQHFYGSHQDPAPYETLSGLDLVDKVINVDQSPIGRTPRSNPATYTGLFTPIRELFADLPSARERGYGPGRFSFNVKGGRCEACQGDGLIKVEMHFLPDVFVPCDTCHGQRYNRETLEIRYRSLNIHDVLALTVEQARDFFQAVPVLARKLQTLLDVGLGYITLGQPATTLSGGEAQRVKLSLELSKRDTGRTLFILDEPTTGLHFHDIDLLLKVLHRLRDQGNTLVVIEHNLDVIKTADRVIDMGPEGGEGGGNILAEGTPEQIAACPTSITGQYLRPHLRSLSPITPSPTNPS